MPSAEQGGSVRSALEGVCVLGMHRSGTSAATRLVNLLGLSTCVESDLLHDPRGNARGHWESISMVEINERLLSEMGRSWWSPPRTGASYELDAGRISSDPVDARDAFDALHPAAPWVWKDPRNALTLPFWLGALDRPVAALVVVRNPLDVAASLRERNRLTIPHGVALWERYNRLILSHVEGMPVHLSRYDDLIADPIRWCESAADFFESCGLSWSGVIEGDSIRNFVDRTLRHSRLGWLEVLSEYAANAAVLDALESSVGAWRSFETPQLPVEAPWVEAEFVAIGSWQQAPLPEPPETTVTVVVASLGASPQEEVDHLSAHLLPFIEGIVVTDAPPDLPDPTDPPVAAGPGGGQTVDRVRVVHVAPGTRLGQARMAGLEHATTDLIDFRAPGATMSDRWLPDMRRAFAAGYAAVTPGVTGASGGGGYGLAWSNRLLNSRWCSRPSDVLETVPLLASACFAVQRSALENIGGFDPDLGVYGLDSQELSLRLWRLGHRCAVTRDAIATVAEQALHVDDPATTDWAAFVHDLLRLAAMHLGLADLTAIADGVRDRPGAAQAIARVIASDVVSRRAALDAAEPAGSEAFLEWCGVQRSTDDTPTSATTADGLTRGATTSVLAESSSVSVIVSSSEGQSAASVVSRLSAELPTGTEIIVDRDRSAGAARARGRYLVFLDAGVEPEAGWAAPLLAAAAEPGAGAVGPAILPYRRRQRAVGGLTFSPRFGDFQWKHLDASTHTDQVPALARSCVVIGHDVYREVGGYDSELDAGGWAEAELCLRLWRAGRSCVVVPSSVVALSQPRWGTSPPRWDDVLYGTLRVAALHLGKSDHTSVLERFRRLRGYENAIACVAGSDAGRRRAAIEARSETSAGRVLRRLCGEAVLD